MEHVAEVAHVPFIGLWLDAPEGMLKDRVTARTGDASDATADVVARQLDYNLGHIGWHRLDAGGALEATREKALARMSEALGAPTPEDRFP